MSDKRKAEDELRKLFIKNRNKGDGSVGAMIDCFAEIAANYIDQHPVEIAGVEFPPTEFDAALIKYTGTYDVPTPKESWIARWAWNRALRSRSVGVETPTLQAENVGLSNNSDSVSVPREKNVQILIDALENAKTDLRDLDTVCMADYKLVISGFSRAVLSIQIALSDFRKAQALSRGGE